MVGSLLGRCVLNGLDSHASPSRMEQELGNLTTGMNNFPRILVSSIIDSLSEIDILEDYSSRSNINLVQDPIRANAVFPEALKASLEPQTQVWVRRELLDPLPDALLEVAV